MDDLPLADGHLSRRLTRDDAQAVTDLVAATELDVDGTVEIDVSDVRVDWERPNFDLATMSVGVQHGDDLVAFAEVYRGRAEVEVHPAHRDKGIGSALMRWTWDAARRDRRNHLSQIVSDAHLSAIELLRAHAYEVGHVSWILRTSLDGDIPTPSLPDGHAIRDWRPGEDDRAVWRVIEDAFSEWPGRDEETPFEDWKATIADHDAVRPDTTPLIVDGDRIVGVAIGMDYSSETSNEGWVQQLAVNRDYRGRGLGRALLHESFRRFKAMGWDRAGLSTDSRTGALALYEHVGMHVDRSFTHWVKRLDDV
jgi:mycothiol synthase